MHFTESENVLPNGKQQKVIRKKVMVLWKERLLTYKPNTEESSIKYTPRSIAQRLTSMYLPRYQVELINKYGAMLHSLIGTSTKDSMRILQNWLSTNELTIYRSHVEQVNSIRQQYSAQMLGATDVINHVNNMR